MLDLFLMVKRGPSNYDYVNTWLKSKTEASGWCQTDAQKQQYIRRYKEKEGITLQNVAKNPGRKQVVKLTGETRKKESNNGLIFERRVRKTVFHAQLQQLRDLEDTDDMGVTTIKALEEATKKHLEKIGAREDDRIFLAMTPQGFEHAYQTVAFPVHEFMVGSTRQSKQEP